MSCESLVDVGVELTTLFEFHFFRICPPEKNARSTMHIRACIKTGKNTRDGVDILNSSTLGVIGVVASAPQMPRPVSANYFRSANTASGLTSGRPSTSVPLCASLPATTQRKTRFTGRRRPFPVQPEVEKWRKPRRELARHDFLYDFNTIYDYLPPFGHKKLLRSGRLTSNKCTDAISCTIVSKNGVKRRLTALSGQTGSRSMAETANLNSQPSVSYSLPITLWGLSRLLLAVYS